MAIPPRELYLYERVGQTKTYFRFEIFSNCYYSGVKEIDIKKLPFYEFWLKKSLGSTQGIFVNENG
nr:hypothetical protein [uncultured Campylobacter sp.]